MCKTQISKFVVLSNQVAALISFAMATWGVAQLAISGADFCAGYLLSFYLAPQVLFFLFVASSDLFLGDRSVAEHRKVLFPWFQIALFGYFIQLVVIVSNFLLNAHGGHC
jgi:hypothetical protein